MTVLNTSHNQIFKKYKRMIMLFKSCTRYFFTLTLLSQNKLKLFFYLLYLDDVKKKFEFYVLLTNFFLVKTSFLHSFLNCPLVKGPFTFREYPHHHFILTCILLNKQIRSSCLGDDKSNTEQQLGCIQ